MNTNEYPCSNCQFAFIKEALVKTLYYDYGTGYTHYESLEEALVCCVGPAEVILTKERVVCKDYCKST